MFVTPAQAGARGSDAHLPFHSRVCRNGKKLLWPLPCADRGNRRPSSAAADEHARPCRHPRADNGEPAFAGWQNPSGTRSAASSSRYLRDDVPVVGIFDLSGRTRLHAACPYRATRARDREVAGIGWALPVPVPLHPREGARAVPIVTGRYVPVSVGGVIYQIYSEAAGAGQDVLCMHTAGADTTRLVSAGSSRACAAVTIGRQDRDKSATNILAANQLGRC